VLLEQRDNFLPLKVIRERLAAGDFDRWVAAGATGTPLWRRKLRLQMR
jgi:hypothetical protein